MEHWSCAAVVVLFNFVVYNTDQLLHLRQCRCGVKCRLMKLADFLYCNVCMCVCVCLCVFAVRINPG